MRSASDLAAKLQAVLTQEERELRALGEKHSATRAGGRPGWTRKQELGHLLDSATNNRVRFISAGIHGDFTGPVYAQDQWVELGGYQALSWEQLVNFWLATNELLAIAVRHIPDEALSATCTIGNNATVTLGFLIADYILHMQHHLDHILDRPQMTPYPGAAIGV